MNRCNCKHLGNCPFRCDPLRITYPDGVSAFRAITPDEPAGGDLPGDALFKDSSGNYRYSRAIDPQRVEEYAKAKLGRKCRAEVTSWAKAHPIPLVGEA